MQAWSSDHPGHEVLPTNMSQANRDVIGPLLNELASQQGHIVIRVEPGGGAGRWCRKTGTSRCA
jgi:hypothetical protein